MPTLDDELSAAARSALGNGDVASAVIFLLASGSTELRLAAAAGIAGEPLARLSAAVLNPAHPIARTLANATSSFDVPPTAPGGPALRSHIPLLVMGAGRRAAAGVLAVAHEDPLDPSSRRALVELADQVSASIERHGGRRGWSP